MTQAEADGLITVLKHIVSLLYFEMPSLGQSKIIDLVSAFNRKDAFIVDVNRPSKIKASRFSLQLRYRKDVILLRLEFDGPPHKNPDDEIIPCPHIHIWKENGGANHTGWAYPIPVMFSKPDDFIKTLKEFLNYCSVVNPESLCITQQTEVNNQSGGEENGTSNG